MHVIDTRGYSCPRPKHMVCQVLLEEGPAQVRVLIDDLMSLEGLLRLAPRYGYSAEEKEAAGWKELWLTRVVP